MDRRTILMTAMSMLVNNSPTWLSRMNTKNEAKLKTKITNRFQMQTGRIITSHISSRKELTVTDRSQRMHLNDKRSRNINAT